MDKISSKNLIIIAVIIGVLIIPGLILYLMQGGTGSNNLSADKVGEKVINFINENILKGQTTASLLEIVEENGLYKLKIKIGEEEIFSYTTLDGKLLFPSVIPLGENPSQETSTETSGKEENSTIGNFLISQDEVCKENGKPIIYFFGLSTCPHCQWEEPILEEVISKFKENITFHKNVDTDTDSEVFSKYSAQGYVPTLVFGCKYYRVGSGEEIGKEEEAKVLTALTCKLTENKPEDVCGQVQELINQIND